MKRNFLFLLILSLFILGCGKASLTSSSKTKTIDVFVGIEGLTSEFVKGAPPPKILQDSEFPVVLRVKNNGAFHVKNAYLNMIRERDYVPKLSVEGNKHKSSIEENIASFDIDGKTELNIKGDEIVIPFKGKTGKLEPQSEQRLSTLTATLCYPYKTTLSTTTCIDPDVPGIRPGKKVCNVKDLIFNSQGAPIAITKIETVIVPEENSIMPQFLIFVENKGIGVPVRPEKYKDACLQSETKDERMWNVAFLKATMPGTEIQLECNPNEDDKADKSIGFLRFRDKKSYVRCTYKGKDISRNSDAYTAPLKVEIDYGYVHTTTTNFLIQKPLKY
ncbi:hypothetical protein HYX02_07550 [Candidatus Woesearchaeota archaeon]|nr:hypothetical protein [Candidatus Woesearchaeota archaeon]